MMRDRRIWGAGIPAALLVAGLIGSAVSQQGVTPAVSDPVAMEHAESLSSAFRSAANTVLPTVVKIKSTVKERRVMRRGSSEDENPFRGTPFEDFFGEDMRRQFEGRMPRRQGTGSGVIIDSSGVILTNNHVVDDADQVVVELADGREFIATEVKTDPETDIAIVRIPDVSGLPVARLGDSDVTQIGDWVLAVGNPFELEASVSAGIISAKGRSIGSARRASFLQTDAAINPGNSGGPLVNLRGEVIGINTAIASSSGGYQGIGFAIPVNLAKWVVDQLVDKGQVSRAWLGIGIGELTPANAELLNVDPRTKGVVVMQVGENTPAERAGLRPEDVITHFAGRPVQSPSELQRVVEQAPMDTKQTVRVLRGGREVELTVTTEPLPSDVAMGQRRSQSSADDDGLKASELGMGVAEVDADLAERFDLPASVKGVVVVSVDARGLAARGGIQRGMLVTELNDQPIQSLDDFEKAVAEMDVERGVKLIVRVPGVGTRSVIIRER
jgi:serine protease Do